MKYRVLDRIFDLDKKPSTEFEAFVIEQLKKIKNNEVTLEFNNLQYFEDHICNDITCYPIYTMKLYEGHVVYFTKNLNSLVNAKFLATYSLYEKTYVDLVMANDDIINVTTYTEEDGFIESLAGKIIALYIAYQNHKVDLDAKIEGYENLKLEIKEGSIKLTIPVEIE